MIDPGGGGGKGEVAIVGYIVGSSIVKLVVDKVAVGNVVVAV